MIMRYIRKTNAPEKLEQYKTRRGASYVALGRYAPDVKFELKEQLMTEQGYLCAYCGSRIDDDRAVIEHVKCRQLYPELQLEYSNMVCSCRGGQDNRRNNQQYPLFCDASKRNSDIPITPLDEFCNDFFVYDEWGGIYDNDSPDAATTIEVLNLDNPVLKNRRRAALRVYESLPDDTDWSRELQILHNRHKGGKYSEFLFVLEYVIRNARMREDD